MLLAAMRKFCRVCLAAVFATAICVLTLVDMPPPQLLESSTDSPPTQEREPPGTRSIVAYSWARRLALDYRASKQCQEEEEEEEEEEDEFGMNEDEKLDESSRGPVTSKASESSRGNEPGREYDGLDDTERSNKWLETIPRRLFLYSAHLDIRVAGYPSVRVIGVKREASPTLLPTGTLYCTIWYADSNGKRRSFSVEALISEIWLEEWGGSREDYTGILVTCQLPRTEGLLRVHVGTTSCYKNPSHSLFVEESGAALDRRMRMRRRGIIMAHEVSPGTEGGGNEAKKESMENGKNEMRMNKRREFTVCIKGLDFDEDISDRLIAFVELNRILGAEMIYVYVFNVHENVSRVLRMYEKSKVVRWFKIELPGDLPNEVSARRRYFASDLSTKRRMELIPYNHCFYENLYESEFVVPIDIDEAILPIERANWAQLIEGERRKLGRSFNDFASYAVRNAYFFPESQTHSQDSPLPRLSRIHRACCSGAGAPASLRNNLTRCVYLETVRASLISPIGDSVKSFVSTERALTVHNHYALTSLHPSTRRAYHLDPRDALKHHHRMCDRRHLDCDRILKQLTIDRTVLRFTDHLHKRIQRFYHLLSSSDNKHLL